jgi:hypothetical protein
VSRVCVTATVRSALTIHENSREFGAYRDELVESSPVPIVTIDFFDGAMAFSGAISLKKERRRGGFWKPVLES